jgi:hypothetical protein
MLQLYGSSPIMSTFSSSLISSYPPSSIKLVKQGLELFYIQLGRNLKPGQLLPSQKTLKKKHRSDINLLESLNRPILQFHAIHTDFA